MPCHHSSFHYRYLCNVAYRYLILSTPTLLLFFKTCYPDYCKKCGLEGPENQGKVTIYHRN
jgi:hypothetical protein